MKLGVWGMPHTLSMQSHKGNNVGNGSGFYTINGTVWGSKDEMAARSPTYQQRPLRMLATPPRKFPATRIGLP